MSTLAEYFAKHRPTAKYQIGDRVEGVFKKIPWVGTVGSDTMRNEAEGSMVSVHLDLPFKIDGEIHQYIRVKYKDLKLRS
jgi:hypothetical protein